MLKATNIEIIFDLWVIYQKYFSEVKSLNKLWSVRVTKMNLLKECLKGAVAW